jgi:hypothetical protein
MTTTLSFTPSQGTMSGSVSDIPAFPGECFSLTIPEGIGDAAQASPPNSITVQWSDAGAGRWTCVGQRPGELDYVVTVTPGADTVDVDISLTNSSPRIWEESLAFTCFNCAQSHSIADFECVRHWSRSRQQMKRLTELPRVYGPRPTIQIYGVAGARPVDQIALAAGFEATPRVLLEGWLAIRSRDGNRVAAVVSNPSLFLFQNMEYSCIHSCPSFGRLAPGQTGTARTRVYFVEATLDAWYQRMKAEMGL